MTVEPALHRTNVRPRRIPRLRLVLIVLAAMGLGTALGLYLWLRTYEPLEWFQGGYGPDLRGGLVYRDVDANEPMLPKTVIALRHRPGRVFRFGFDLHNGGRFGVRLDGLPKDDGAAPLRLVGLQLQPSQNLTGFEGVVPFRPITLRPGAYQYLVVLVRIRRCPRRSGNLVTSIDSIPLRYSYLHVFHKVQTVELPLIVAMSCGDAKFALP